MIGSISKDTQKSFPVTPTYRNPDTDTQVTIYDSTPASNNEAFIAVFHDAQPTDNVINDFAADNNTFCTNALIYQGDNLPIFGDPVESATFYVDSIVSLYGGNEDFYRAAYMSADKVGLFDDRESPEGFVQQSEKIARLCCTAALEDGFLLGNIDTQTLLRQLYDCHRIGRQDWVYGQIDLDEYRDRTLEAILTVYASDASPECHNRLCKKIREIGI